MSEDDHNRIFNRKSEVICTCGWEVKFGYSVAFTLAVLEVKRLLVFALEIFAEWHVIRLAGGFAPIVFTLIDVSLGLPCALITVRTIRRFVHLKFIYPIYMYYMIKKKRKKSQIPNYIVITQ